MADERDWKNHIEGIRRRADAVRQAAGRADDSGAAELNRLADELSTLDVTKVLTWLNDPGHSGRTMTRIEQDRSLWPQFKTNRKATSQSSPDKTFLYSGLAVVAFGLFFWFTLDTSWVGITLAIIGALLVIMAVVRDGDPSDES